MTLPKRIRVRKTVFFSPQILMHIFVLNFATCKESFKHRNEELAPLGIDFDIKIVLDNRFDCQTSTCK